MIFLFSDVLREAGPEIVEQPVKVGVDDCGILDSVKDFFHLQRMN